jgi:hypothetical protein
VKDGYGGWLDGREVDEMVRKEEDGLVYENVIRSEVVMVLRVLYVVEVFLLVGQG